MVAMPDSPFFYLVGPILQKTLVGVLAHCLQKTITAGALIEYDKRLVDQRRDEVKNFVLFDLRYGGFRHHPFPIGRNRRQLKFDGMASVRHGRVRVLFEADSDLWGTGD